MAQSIGLLRWFDSEGDKISGRSARKFREHLIFGSLNNGVEASTCGFKLFCVRVMMVPTNVTMADGGFRREERLHG